jgi:hypothetical protein
MQVQRMRKVASVTDIRNQRKTKYSHEAASIPSPDRCIWSDLSLSVCDPIAAAAFSAARRRF